MRAFGFGWAAGHSRRGRRVGPGRPGGRDPGPASFGGRIPRDRAGRLNRGRGGLSCEFGGGLGCRGRDRRRAGGRDRCHGGGDPSDFGGSCRPWRRRPGGRGGPRGRRRSCGRRRSRGRGGPGRRGGPGGRRDGRGPCDRSGGCGRLDGRGGHGGCRRVRRRFHGPAGTRQQVVVVEVRVERERASGGELGDEVGLLGRVELGHLHRLGLRRLGLRHRAGGALARSLDRGIGHELAEQPDRPDRVVVGRDDVVELVRVDVGVARADDRDLELVGLGHRDPLAVRVDDEDGARLALHLADATERRLELVELLGQQRGLLLRQPVEVAGLLARLELVEQADPLLDGHEVGEHAAEPALGHVRLAGADRLLHDRLLRLLLGADEQDVVAAGDGLGDELQRRVQALDRLGEVDDVDPVALREDERAHLGVPAPGLVAEVDAGLKELAHRDGGHCVASCGSFLRESPAGAGGNSSPGPAPSRRETDPRVCSVPANAGRAYLSTADGPRRGGV